ncbi:MAG: phosphate/phosphite/phosphonate ABC transporter substrate-binding protein [Ignavibacteria bacterium]|nr:phosphate/phosphite/phosphonate ABC transporter substrate-binding protein [Ignavibacteria bacterium]
MKSLIRMLILCQTLSLNLITYSQNGNSISKEAINFVYSEKLFPKVNSHDAKASIKLWTKEMISDLREDYFVNNIFVKGIATLDNSFIQQEIDFIIMSALEYIVNYDKLGNLNPIVVSTLNGIIGVEYLILSHKDNNFISLNDLKNQKIALVDDYSNAIPQVWLDVILKTNKLSIASEYFKEILLSNNTNQAILKTFFKQVGACIVPKNLYESSLELNPQLASELVILEQSEPFLLGVFCSHKKVDNELTTNVTQFAKEVQKNTKGKQFTLFFRIGDIIEYKSKHIENVRKLVDDAERYNIKLNR